MPTIRTRAAALPAGVFRARDAGISGVALARLAREGLVERLSRGLYVKADARVTEHRSLAEAASRVPAGVVCLLSALAYHRLTTQNPTEVWLAIGGKARKPGVEWPPLRIVRFSDAALTFGAETHVLEHVRVTITSREKTIADCFKYRNKIGIDVALEALREYLRSRKRSVDRLMEAATVDRVAGVLRPYLEALA